MYRTKNWLPIEDLFTNLDDYKFKSFDFDTYENDGNYFIEIMLPGFEKENIKLDYNDKKIIIKAERIPNNEYEYIQKNSFFGKKSETYKLNFEPEKIDAEFENGVLRMKLKRKESNLPVIKFK